MAADGVHSVAALELSAGLPIVVSASQLREHRGLQAVLEAIAATDMTPHAISRRTQARLQEAQLAMEGERCAYLQNKLLVDQLFELLDQRTPASQPEDKVYDALQRVLLRQLAEQHLDCEPSGPGGTGALLGLSNDVLHAVASATPTELQEIQQLVIPKLETRLREQCEALARCYHTEDHSNEGLVFAKAQQLPELLQRDAARLEALELETTQRRHEVQTAFWQCLEVALQELNVLHQMLVKHKLDSQRTADEVFGRFLQASCDAARGKLGVTLKQIQLKTYSPENVAALRKIRYHLEAKVAECRQELAQAREQLAMYKALGPQFEQIATTYADLTADIGNQRWGMQTLGQPPP